MDVKGATAAERRELADLLDGLTEEQWEAPSLCDGWRVREVAAHMSLGFRYSLPRMLGAVVRARGSVNRMADRCAHADARTFTTGQLAAFLRDNATHPWTPPVGGVTAALGHDVVHGLDITLALGIDRRVPQERVLALLEKVTPRGAKFFGADIEGVAFRADDLDWSLGSGTPLTGTGQDLLMALYGRRLPPGRLEGGASARFSALSVPGDDGAVRG